MSSLSEARIKNRIRRLERKNLEMEKRIQESMLEHEIIARMAAKAGQASLDRMKEKHKEQLS